MRGIQEGSAGASAIPPTEMVASFIKSRRESLVSIDKLLFNSRWSSRRRVSTLTHTQRTLLNHRRRIETTHLT